MNSCKWLGIIFLVVQTFLSGCLDVNAGYPADSGKNNLMKGDEMNDVRLFLIARAQGDLYQKEKEKLLSSAEYVSALLEESRDSDQWEDHIAASIIDGWHKHGKLYEIVLGEIESIDAEKYRQTVKGIEDVWDTYSVKAFNNYKKDILPLCWEMILKFGNQYEEWKIITFLYMISALPDERSIEPVMHLIENTDKEELRRRAAKAISFLPKNAVRSRLQQSEEKSSKIMKAVKDALFDIDYE